MDWSWIITVWLTVSVGSGISYYLGYRKGAKRVLNEWKDWLNQNDWEES